MKKNFSKIRNHFIFSFKKLETSSPHFQFVTDLNILLAHLHNFPINFFLLEHLSFEKQTTIIHITLFENSISNFSHHFQLLKKKKKHKISIRFEN